MVREFGIVILHDLIFFCNTRSPFGNEFRASRCITDRTANRGVFFFSQFALNTHMGLQVTNTVPQKQHCDGMKKLVVLDVTPTIAESIRRTHNGESISLLFGEWAGGSGLY